MRDDADEEALDPELQAALASLRSDREPPDHLEPELVASLHSARHFTPPRQWTRHAWPLLAACITIAAFLAGRVSVRPSPTLPGLDDRDDPRFALFLLETPGFDPPDDSDTYQRLMEYHDWGVARSEAGGYLIGDELAPGEAVTLTAESGIARSGGPGLLGIFILHARSMADAVGIARTLPHLRHGGEVSVVPIVDH
jgi:hypothetical protein